MLLAMHPWEVIGGKLNDDKYSTTTTDIISNVDQVLHREARTLYLIFTNCVFQENSNYFTYFKILTLSPQPNHNYGMNRDWNMLTVLSTLGYR